MVIRPVLPKFDVKQINARRLASTSAALLLFPVLFLGATTIFSPAKDHGWSRHFNKSELQQVGPISYRFETTGKSEAAALVAQPFAKDAWTHLTGSRVPHGERGYKVLWESFTLPAQTAERYLYLKDVEQSLEVYLDGKTIYTYGDVTRSDPTYFSGWGWHLIRLPHDAAGKRIFVRIASTWDHIGFSSAVNVGTLAAIIERETWDDVTNLVLACCLVFGGLITLATAILVSKDLALGAQALIYLASAVIMLEGTFLGRLLWYDNALWSRSRLYAMYLLMPLFAAFVKGCIYPHCQKFMKGCALFFLGYFMFSAVGDAFHLIHISAVSYPFICFGCIALPLMTALAISSMGRAGNRVLVLALVASCFFGMMEGMHQLGWLEGKFFLSWGIMCFFVFTLLMQILNMMEKKRKSNQEFVERMSSLGRLAGGIAHEINNPLAIILGHVERIKRELSKEEINKGALIASHHTIVDMISRVTRVTEGMLHLTRDISKGSRKVVVVADVIESAVSLCQGEFAANEIMFAKNMDLHPVELYCHPAQISQALLAVFYNAIDAVKTRKEKWIHLEVKETRHHVRIMITNSGADIPESERKKIFLPFFTSKGFSGGANPGLGLAIAHSIVEKHGGNIYLDNSHPHTRFTIVLAKYEGNVLPQKAG